MPQYQRISLVINHHECGEEIGLLEAQDLRRIHSTPMRIDNLAALVPPNPSSFGSRINQNEALSQAAFVLLDNVRGAV